MIQPKQDSQLESFFAHNPSQQIAIPALDHNIFAVIQFQGRQHKVTTDDLIMLDKTEYKCGEVIIFDKVLLVGTTDYTSVGRPLVHTAKVIGTVEENSKTEKVIIFKKRRRKGYQKNMGHRQEITMVRIDKIIHSPTEEILSNYKSLI